MHMTKDKAIHKKKKVQFIFYPAFDDIMNREYQSIEILLHAMEMCLFAIDIYTSYFRYTQSRASRYEL